jgi:uncharacterized protein
MDATLQNHLPRIAQQVNLPARQVKATIQLLTEGATIPFVARYRKERTGSLDEVQITNIQQAYQQMLDLDQRKATILKAIEEQGKLTPDLQKRIEQCFDSTELEDIYLPYKRKRKTRASVARELGLEPLAEQIFQQSISQPVEALAEPFLSEEVPDVVAALQGARDIIAEWINENEKARNRVRQLFRREATIRSKVARGKKEEGAKYEDYFDFEEPLKKCPSHRLLAIRRGEEEGFLRVTIGPEKEQVLYQLKQLFVKGQNECGQQVNLAVEDGYDRLLAPAIETEFRNLAKEKADEEAIEVFAENLRQLLLAAPLGQKRVIGIDPGYRTGCKVVVLSEQGDLLQHTAIYPHPPQKQAYESIATLQHLIDQHHTEAVAVGNGTAGRETVALLREKLGQQVEIFMVNESGASIYSASPIAREEFPDQDVTVRGAVSIGRRLMDPLAELVKIDPKSIGVGQYQHDVNQTNLKASLDRVVESCVNQVGINLNTASKHLLTYVSGLGPSTAQNIVDYRATKGPFSKRQELLKVPRLGEKAFEQAAGFLRIRDGKHPLDNTGVHPESYHLVQKMADDLGCSIEDLLQQAHLRKQIDLPRYQTDTVGMPTLKDILKELEKPGLDPRGKAKTFEFAKGIHSIQDVQEGMILPGIVTNITNFGAFVDIGVKQDGLVHVSQLANRFVRNPADVISLQQKVQVKVVGIDLKRNRIQLSIKQALHPHQK